MAIDLTGRVAVVTGAGGGLGRAHALLLARRGARVVINDLGQDGSSPEAEAVAAEIGAAGGEAFANGASVTDQAAVGTMVEETLRRWGRIDILVNNAGILRDRSFAKMDLDDFRAVVEVHLMGSVICTRAVWDAMRAQRYGRVVLTTSSSGLFGNFGQSNYGAAKMALVGLMQVLAIEGRKYGIRVNCLAPTAATRMTEPLLAPELLERLAPEAVSPAVLALASEDAPTRTILCAGGGSVEQAHVVLTRGVFVGDADDAAEEIEARRAEIADLGGAMIPEEAWVQGRTELEKGDPGGTGTPGTRARSGSEREGGLR